MDARFWSDDFDMDLPTILPGLDEALGPAADIPLWTYGRTSHGRLNHPAVWGHADGGMVAYFGTDNTERWKPDWYTTSQPLIACTWREAVRDAWPHTYVVIVDSVQMWDTHRLWSTFNRLMYDLRGWRKLPSGEADRLRGHVLASVIAATRQLERHVEAVGHA
jgi:hypothetical protein